MWNNWYNFLIQQFSFCYFMVLKLVFVSWRYEENQGNACNLRDFVVPCNHDGQC